MSGIPSSGARPSPTPRSWCRRSTTDAEAPAVHSAFRGLLPTAVWRAAREGPRGRTRTSRWRKAHAPEARPPKAPLPRPCSLAEPRTAHGRAAGAQPLHSFGAPERACTGTGEGQPNQPGHGPAGWDALTAGADRHSSATCRPPRAIGGEARWEPPGVASVMSLDQTVGPSTKTSHIRYGSYWCGLAILGLARLIFALLDVLRHQLLERLELVEELFRWDLAVGLGSTQQPRRGVDRGSPTDLIGIARGR